MLYQTLASPLNLSVQTRSALPSPDEEMESVSFVLSKATPSRAGKGFVIRLTVHIRETKVGAVKVLVELDLSRIEPVAIFVAEPGSRTSGRFHAKVVDTSRAAVRVR